MGLWIGDGEVFLVNLIMNQTYHIVISQGRDGSMTLGPFQFGNVPFLGTGYIGFFTFSIIAELYTGAPGSGYPAW